MPETTLERLRRIWQERRQRTQRDRQWVEPIRGQPGAIAFHTTEPGPPPQTTPTLTFRDLHQLQQEIFYQDRATRRLRDQINTYRYAWNTPVTEGTPPQPVYLTTTTTRIQAEELYNRAFEMNALPPGDYTTFFRPLPIRPSPKTLRELW
jgi:hypothetical protein